MSSKRTGDEATTILATNPTDATSDGDASCAESEGPNAADLVVQRAVLAVLERRGAKRDLN